MRNSPRRRTAVFRRKRLTDGERCVTIVTTNVNSPRRGERQADAAVLRRYFSPARNQVIMCALSVMIHETG